MASSSVSGARSPAWERRQRKARSEARLRLKLASDAALLAAHHTAPRAARFNESTHALVKSLVKQVLSLQQELGVLRVTVALLPPNTATSPDVPRDPVGP